MKLALFLSSFESVIGFMSNMFFESDCLSDTEKIGESIALELPFPACVYLKGEMGAGKTTLTKSIIRGLGYDGEVTSPTYNLIQEYPVEQGTVYHMDLYRLDDPAEIEYLAIEDLWSKNSVFLIEWAEKGKGYLRVPSHEISINKNFDHSEFVRNIVLKKTNK